MPGENCAIYGCTYLEDITRMLVFKVPEANNDFNKKWVSELINIITKDTVNDKPLKDRIERHKFFICGRHFTSDQICVYPDHKKLIDGALPSLNLPPNISDSFTSTAPHSSPSITKRSVNNNR